MKNGSVMQRRYHTAPDESFYDDFYKLYKEFSQSYMNAIRTLCSLLHKVEGIEEDPVQEFLKGRNNVQ